MFVGAVLMITASNKKQCEDVNTFPSIYFYSNLPCCEVFFLTSSLSIKLEGQVFFLYNSL